MFKRGILGHIIQLLTGRASLFYMNFLLNDCAIMQIKYFEGFITMVII